MQLRRERSSDQSDPGSIWRALGLQADSTIEISENRLAQFAEVAAVWPFVVFAQLLAPISVAVVLHVGGREAELTMAAGALMLGAALVTLCLFRLERMRAWPTHVQARLLTLTAAVIGGALLSLVPILTVGPLTQAHLAGFVAVFAAVTITAIALHPVRAATLGYAAVLTAMVIARTGFTFSSGVALIALTALVVATVRLARGDERVAHQRSMDSSAGRLAEQLVREVEEHGDGWFWQTDRQGYLTYLSGKVGREFARRGIETLGTKLVDVFRMDSASTDTERTLSFHLSTRTSFSEYSVCPASDADGKSDRWWSISGRPLMDDLGRHQGFVGSGRDLTEKRRSEAEITRLALFDSLTGLANRQRMRVSLDSMLSQQSGGTGTLALFLLDLDRFKAVNDTLGHQVGDTLLKQVAQRLERAVGDAGLVGRLGGDEFKVILPAIGNRERLGEIATTIINSLSQPYFIEGSSISIGASIGIAIAPTDGHDSETLTRNADIAMYAAKGDGRGIHRFFREELLEGAKTRKQLEDDLRLALISDQFHVAYQPVVSTEGARIVGYEALLRWDHPTRGGISPAEFIPIAEESGLIESIGEWVLRTATREAAGWPGNVRVAVNVSPIQFANPALPAIVTSALANSGLDPNRLELEITESVFVNDSSSADDMFKALKGIGVRLALDDFGTGYSSLGYLKKAPFDKIKIDQSFVRGAAVPGNRNAAIIKAIVTLANTLYMETTAEGVELQDEIELIRELGCSHIQGYVYGKAARSDEVTRQLQAAGGLATAQGFRVSRAPRTTMLRSAMLDLGIAAGEVRIRNISSTGAMIDGIEFPCESAGVDVQIELLEGQMFPATVRWARDGRAGLEFAQYFNLERLNPVPARTALRKAG